MDILQKALDELSQQQGQEQEEQQQESGHQTLAARRPSELDDSIKVLAIAPFESMADLFQTVALDYPQIQLTVEIGDRETGLSKALTVFEANYDVVISRGGTARVLEEEVSIPVIDVEVSALDVLRQIRAEGVEEKRVAAVGFEGPLANLERGQDILPSTFDIYALEFADEAPLVMDEVSKKDYALVLCDNVSYLEATRRHLPAKLLESGEDSIRQAFEAAIFHCRYWRLSRERSRLLWDLARNQSGRLVIYLRGGGLVFSNLTDKDTALYDFLERHVSDTHSRRLVFRHLRTIYRIKPIHMSREATGVIAFSINVYEASVQAGLAGVEYLNLDSVAEQVDESFFVKTHALTMLSGNVDEGLELGRPIMLCGEPGIGKRHLARLLYLASDYSDRPFIEIDCELLNKRSEKFLTESYHSPLYGTNQTIYLHGVQYLRETTMRELLAIAVESRLAKRCNLILSGDLAPDGKEPANVPVLAERLKCVILDIPALRTKPEAIPEDVLRYLQTLSNEAGRKMPSISPEALDLLSQYPWPRNNFQLQKVLDRLFMWSRDTDNISADDVRRATAREEVQTQAAATTGSFDVLQPLSDIERKIAREVLKRCDGNRTAAAKSLDISRTTLWRLLKEE